MEKKSKNIGKIILRVVLIMLLILVLFILGVFVYHNVKRNEEIALLKEKGYYNPVSVGDYNLNVAKFGNENGKHTIVAMAGLGSGDYPVTLRKATSNLEEDNLVVFVDRAGYGLSDSADSEMTLEYIVEDYRKALKNAGLEAPYVLLPHSIAGAYATYWVSKYPDEIEAVAFIDGSQLDANAFGDEPVNYVDFSDHFRVFLCKLGLSRLVLRNDVYLYPESFSDEEQTLGDALMLMTFESINCENEDSHLAENAQGAFNSIVTNDVPKLYICAGSGAVTKEDIIELNTFVNKQIEQNGLDLPLRSTSFDDDDELLNKLLDQSK